MIAAEFSWVNLNSRERRMQILEMVLLLHHLLIMRNYEGWSGMRDPCIRKRVILILHIVHGDSNCSDHGGCPIKTISVAIVMSISRLDATMKLSPVSSPFSVNFSSSMKGSSVKLLGWARVVTRPSRAARVTSTGTMERAIIALTALTASSSSELGL